MEIKPYNDEESKKNQISKMFNNIAPRYDFLNRFLSLGIDKLWRKTALNELKGHPVNKVLDIATGTADVAIATARLWAPEQIIGIDISTEMLEIGRKKVQAAQFQEIISLESGDAENMVFKDNTFDAITVAFGVRNFEDLNQGLSEMQRVLKTNGKVIILEFSKPHLFPFKQLFDFYFKYILPVIGKMSSKDPKAYQYLYESVQAFPEGEQFVSILSKNGFKSIKSIPLTLGICTVYTAVKS